MAAIELNLNPTTKQLRQFGLIGLFALPLIGWLFAGKPTAASWHPAHTQWVGAFAAVGGVMGLLALIRPTFLKWVFIGLSIVTFPIGFVLGEVLMQEDEARVLVAKARHDGLLVVGRWCRRCR